MDRLGLVGFALVICGGVICGVFLVVGLFHAGWAGFAAAIALAGFAILFVKVLRDRMENKEDHHYSKSVDL